MLSFLMNLGLLVLEIESSDEILFHLCQVITVSGFSNVTEKEKVLKLG